MNFEISSRFLVCSLPRTAKVNHRRATFYLLPAHSYVFLFIIIYSCQSARYSALHQPALPQEPPLQGHPKIVGSFMRHARHGQIHTRPPPEQEWNRVLSVARGRSIFLPFRMRPAPLLMPIAFLRTRSESRKTFVMRARAE